jgi:hypothetical protein
MQGAGKGRQAQKPDFIQQYPPRQKTWIRLCSSRFLSANLLTRLSRKAPISARSLFLVSLIVPLTPVADCAAGDWQFRLTPYVWFAGLKGDVATIPGAPSAPIDISPSDALDDTEAGVIVMFDAKRRRHGLFADFLYTDVQSDEELLPPPISLTLRSVTRRTIFFLAYQYALVNQDQAVVDLMLGAR